MASYTAPLVVTSADVGTPTRTAVTGRPTPSSAVISTDHGQGPRAAVDGRPTPAAVTLEANVGLVPLDSTTIDRLQGRYTQVVNGLQPQAEVGAPTRATVTRTAQRPAVTVEDGGSGAHIPTAYFRTVYGQCVDEEGKPLSNAKYLIALDGLPTAAPVDDSGKFGINILKNKYSEFVLVASSGRDSVDYTWYSPLETVVEPGDNYVTLVFRTEELKGMMAGGGSSMGGQLG